MHAFSFTITCLLCGGRLQFVSETRWNSGERKAVVRCVEAGCMGQWLVGVDMTQIHEPGSSKKATERKKRVLAGQRK